MDYIKNNISLLLIMASFVSNILGSNPGDQNKPNHDSEASKWLSETRLNLERKSLTNEEHARLQPVLKDLELAFKRASSRKMNTLKK